MKFKDECFFLVDILHRKFDLDTMTYAKTNNTIGVFPVEQKRLFKTKKTKEDISGFTFVRTKAGVYDISHQIGNLLRISSDGKNVVEIVVDKGKVHKNTKEKVGGKTVYYRRKTDYKLSMKVKKYPKSIGWENEEDDEKRGDKKQTKLNENEKGGFKKRSTGERRFAQIQPQESIIKFAPFTTKF